MDNLDLLIHPVRLRIVHSLAASTALTTGERCSRRSDLGQATVYRHVRWLAEHGVIEVVGERRGRGAVERRYGLNRKAAAITAEGARRMSNDDHRRAFAAALGVLIAEFDRYLARPRANPARDLVAYRQLPLWLSDSEVKELIARVTREIERCAAHGKTKDRQAYLVSPILFPLATPPAGG